MRAFPPGDHPQSCSRDGGGGSVMSAHARRCRMTRCTSCLPAQPNSAGDSSALAGSPTYWLAGRPLRGITRPVSATSTRVLRLGYSSDAHTSRTRWCIRPTPRTRPGPTERWCSGFFLASPEQSWHDDDVRLAAHAELTGYWTRAASRPWWWLDPVFAELGLAAMARGRHALATGQLLTKTGAIDVVHGPPWLIDQLRARRHGQDVTLPRLRTAGIAWLDVRRTTSQAKRWTRPSR